MSAVSCNKSQPEDPAITSVKAGCVGDWTGEIESKSSAVISLNHLLFLNKPPRESFAPDDKLYITGHASPKMLKKYIKADSLEVVEKPTDKYEYFR